MISVNEWHDWKSNPVTKAFYEACDFRIEDAKDVLSSSAGIDSSSDSFYRGFIHAYREMLDFKVEELGE